MLRNYQRFHPDLWIIDNNFEMIASATSPTKNVLQVDGHFRTTNDFGALIFRTEEYWNHEYVRYDEKPDYRDSRIRFSVNYDGAIVMFNDTAKQPSLTVRTIVDGMEIDRYATLGFYGNGNNTESENFNFDGSITLRKKWIDYNNYWISWVAPDGSTGDLEDVSIGTDYDIDFVNGKFFTAMGKIPLNSLVTIRYNYYTHEYYDIDFNKLYEGTHPNSKKKIPTNNVERVLLPIFSPKYDFSGNTVGTGISERFSIKFNFSRISGGDLGAPPTRKKPHKWRLAEGYDDEYNKNPKRLIESMYWLGYSGPINYYIGASHYYDKYAEEGVEIMDQGDMTLDDSKGLNKAYIAWTSELYKNMKLCGFNKIIISVALENLQMPLSWAQKMANGEYGQTGWDPPTKFYSMVNAEVRTYVKKITQENIDLANSVGIRSALQLGELWYWWQEFAPGNVNEPYEGKPPCFYDQATQDRYESEFGEKMPKYYTSDVEDTPKARQVAEFIQGLLGEYTYFMRDIARENNKDFTVLFFPPSVLEVDRVPWIMRQANFPAKYWSAPNLDFIQVEDYDWVTGEVVDHEGVFDLSWEYMQYPFSKMHYFAGFVLKHENAEKEWALIERAGQQAFGRRCLEVFVWAGTQVRRDSWHPADNTYRPDNVNRKYVQSDYIGNGVGDNGNRIYISSIGNDPKIDLQLDQIVVGEHTNEFEYVATNDSWAYVIIGYTNGNGYENFRLENKTTSQAFIIDGGYNIVYVDSEKGRVTNGVGHLVTDEIFSGQFMALKKGVNEFVVDVAGDNVAKDLYVQFIEKKIT